MNVSKLGDVKPSQCSILQLVFFCSHIAVFKAEPFYIDSLYNFISGVLLICVNENLVTEISML